MEFNIDIINDIENTIEDFREESNVERINDLTSNQYKALCMKVGFAVFKSHNIAPSRWDMESLEALYTHYAYITNRYDQIISIDDYSAFSTIDYSTFYDWLHMKRGSINNELPSVQRSDYIKKILKDTEESLVQRLTTARRNPIGILSVLNHRYNWESTQTSKLEQIKTETLETSDNLPRLRAD